MVFLYGTEVPVVCFFHVARQRREEKGWEGVGEERREGRKSEASVPKNDLIAKFGLVLDKATCSVTGLFNLLHYHWCQDADGTSVHGRYRVQAALLVQPSACTSSRPGAVIRSNCYNG